MIEQMQFFLMIEKLNSFSEAANELYISQSALSKQIKSLERQLGFELFDRTTRKIQITPAGEVFLKYAHRIISEYNNMLEEAGKYQKEIVRLNIASIPVLEAYHLFDVFDEFQRETPNIVVAIEECERPFALSELRRGLVDMAILRSNFINKEDFFTIPFIEDELVLIIPEAHPFAGRGKVFLADAANENFYFLSKNTGMYSFCVEACRKAGFSPNVMKSELNRRSIRSKILHGEGISMMAETVAKEISLPGITYVKLKEHLMVDLAFVLKNEKIGENADNLIRYVKTHVQREMPAVI
ncbi:MAG: LysR family transcriptional regulator [Clostridiales Family XIII bacterium]|jgi:DNA-binding transcriptional LysR family regulator|nr:LysR family transcriptional regulator [Clostridiales Family XIII bacterium]